MTTALQILIIVTLIGIIGGLAISRHGRGRFMTHAGGLAASSLSRCISLCGKGPGTV